MVYINIFYSIYYFYIKYIFKYLNKLDIMLKCVAENDINGIHLLKMKTWFLVPKTSLGFNYFIQYFNFTVRDVPISLGVQFGYQVCQIQRLHGIT